jgi:uncharacterized protein
VKIVSEYPRAVRVIDPVWIPMSDGIGLAAKIWLPEDADDDPVPAVLELLPYRRTDGTAARDEVRYPYVAGHGYAGVRVDLRGSGDSGGVLDDEYSEQEQRDAEEVIAWLAAQPWCTGSVGMWGISWGGFNSLQLAARRPPALKAIIAMMASDDRYADDVHYRGGAVLGLDMVHWSTYMLLANAQPPDPAVVGERWRDLWHQRLEANRPLADLWLAHQRRDGYWRHGSVCEDYDAIECAVYAVGGWQDGYTNAVPRLLERLSCPRRGLIGPWGHCFPESGTPLPAVGFLQEAVRWWDHWLKGRDTGMMDEPTLRAYVQDSVRPRVTYRERPGRWYGAAAWPPPEATPLRFHLNAGTLGSAAEPPVEFAIRGRQTTGIDAAGPWCGEGAAADDPDDQRRDDGESLCFTSAPLDDDLALLGFPKVTLELAADRPLAVVCVRLCEVFGDGASKLVTRGVLNLTHRNGHEHPEPLEPGRTIAVEVELDAIGHVFAAGNRIRVAVSPTYWPWLWPSPQPVTLRLRSGQRSTLVLPAIPRGWTAPPAFDEPVQSPPLPVGQTHEGVTSRTVMRDLASGLAELRFLWGSGGEQTLPNGTRTLFENEATYGIVEDDPLSARVLVTMAIEFERPGGEWSTRIEARGEMTCDAERFSVDSRVEAREAGQIVHERTYRREFPRDLG